jgi:hypothetical protein
MGVPRRWQELAGKTKGPIRSETARTYRSRRRRPAGECDLDRPLPGYDAMPPVDLRDARPGLLVCDAVFNPPETRLLAAARQRGLATLDGLSMLVYQGVIGFQLWTGQDAPEEVMKSALRAALGLA